MTKRFLYILVFIGLFFTACIPNRDLIYLQKKGGPQDTTAVAAVASKPYRLQTNDIINVTIKAIDPKLVDMFRTSDVNQISNDQTLYFNGYTVDDHGNIRIPVLGVVNVLGFSLEEVRAKVVEMLLADYFNEEANIYVSVKLAGFRYTVNGEVSTPGSKILFQEKVNILEALANSGDITITGDRKKVSVIIQFPQGTEIHDIDLTDINAMKSPYYYLQPNDYIYVKPLPQKSWGTGTTGVQSFTTIISILTLIVTTGLLLTQ